MGQRSVPSADGRQTSERTVSVIVPVYNVQEYLQDCVDSVLRQTHEDLDVILVDDGSTDGSGRLCDEYGARDDRVRVIHQTNAGPSAARNRGIRAARGSWFTFVDSDDWISPSSVESLLSALQDHQADIAVAGFVQARYKESSEPAETGAAGWTVLTRTEALRAYLGPRNTQMTTAWGKLYSRDIWDGIEFPMGRVHEDEFTTYRVMGKARRVVVSERALYHYRVRPGSIMAEMDVPRQVDLLDALRGRVDYFRSLGMEHEADETLRRLFSKSMRVRREARVAGDSVRYRSLSRSTRELAGQLSSKAGPLHVRGFCVAYRIAPGPMNLLYDAYAIVAERRRSWGHIQESEPVPMGDAS